MTKKNNSELLNITIQNGRHCIKDAHEKDNTEGEAIRCVELFIAPVAPGSPKVIVCLAALMRAAENMIVRSYHGTNNFDNHSRGHIPSIPTNY